MEFGETMMDMHGCKETVRRWPETFDEVSPDELEDFIAHAENCAYHTAALRAAEEELLPRARAARALSGDGSILVGEKSDRAVVENRRLMQIWREVAAKRELPFCRIALRHDGRDIDRCDNFLDLNNHDSVHELDAHIRLEVWGIITGDGVKVEARLGTYDLRRDPAEGEKFYEVGNGYEVGLNVREIGVEVFKVQYRCVENKKLTRMQNGEQKAQAAVARGGLTPGSGDTGSGRKRRAARVGAAPKQHSLRVWPLLPPSWQPSVQITLGLVLVVVAVTIANAMEATAAGRLQQVEQAQKLQRAEAVQKLQQEEEAEKRRQAEAAEKLRQEEAAVNRRQEEAAVKRMMLALLREVEQNRSDMRVRRTSASTMEGVKMGVELREPLKDYSERESRAPRVAPPIPIPAVNPPLTHPKSQRDAKVGKPNEQSAVPGMVVAGSGGGAKGMA